MHEWKWSRVPETEARCQKIIVSLSEILEPATLWRTSLDVIRQIATKEFKIEVEDETAFIGALAQVALEPNTVRKVN